MNRKVELKLMLSAFLAFASANSFATVDLEWIGFDDPPPLDNALQ